MRHIVVMLALSMVALGLALGLATAAGADPAPPPPRAESPAWVVEARALGHAAVGQPAQLEIVVETRGGYHLNDDYPINFRPAAASVATFEKPRLDRKDGVVTAPCASEASHACGARATVRYTPKVAGQARLGGTFAFSACDAERCTIEKVEVAAAIDVAAR